MRLGGCHTGLAREIAQHHRLAAAGERAEQLSAHFNRLNAAAVPAHESSYVARNPPSTGSVTPFT
jgi:hypothetical protein